MKGKRAIEQKAKHYKCPYCSHTITTIVPTKNEVTEGKGYWDSAVVCPSCKTMHFKKVYPSGKIKILKPGEAA